MLPVLLALSAVHVAMPILERGSPSRASWLERLDLLYMPALPAVAALLAHAIAPDRGALSHTLVALGAIWALAAGSAEIHGAEHDQQPGDHRVQGCSRPHDRRARGRCRVDSGLSNILAVIAAGVVFLLVGLARADAAGTNGEGVTPLLR
jgi:hypothetical protein